MAYNFDRAGREFGLFVTSDRSGESSISSRLGHKWNATQIDQNTDLGKLIWEDLSEVVIIDEAQFLTTKQIEALHRCSIYPCKIYCFGLLTTFKSNLFEGSKRLIELADELIPMPVGALCWCGQKAHFNARIINNEVVCEGEDVVIADIVREDIRYTTLCNQHCWERKLA